MKTAEKESLKEALVRLVSRLEELLSRQVEFEEGWDIIYINIKTVHNKFKDVVNAYILQSNYLKDSIETSQWTYAFFNSVVDYLYLCTFKLRNLFPYLFGPPSPNRLYYYCFLDELLNCFPKTDNMPSTIKYVMIGTGDIAHWPIQEMLIGRNISFEALLIPEAKAIFEDIKATNISGFECDFQEPLDRQIVLAHEFFHILVDFNPAVKSKFREIIGKPEVISVFDRVGQSLNLGHIEELFCDFGATWFFGPAYAKAFIEEIVFRERERTETHPQRVVRLLVILSTYPKKTKYHKYFQVFNRYYQGQRQIVELSLDDIEVIAKEFKKIMSDLALKRYTHPDDMYLVRNCLCNNVSYMYTEKSADVRQLMNNLPEKTSLSEREQNNYNDFIFESIRKNILLSEFNSIKSTLRPRIPPHN